MADPGSTPAPGKRVFVRNPLDPRASDQSELPPVVAIDAPTSSPFDTEPSESLAWWQRLAIGACTLTGVIGLTPPVEAMPTEAAQSAAVAE